MRRASIWAFCISILLFPILSRACPAGQYQACAGPTINAPGVHIQPTCVCVPNSGQVVNGVTAAVNPLPDTLNLFGAIVHGNINQAYTALGGLVTQAACLPCSAGLQIYASQGDRQAIEQLVGRGWLTYVTGQPELFFVDAGGTQSQQMSLAPPPAAPIAPAAAPRGKKQYITTGASCIVENGKTKQISAGWVDPPSLVDPATNGTGRFPNVDLQPGDTIQIGSNNECKVASTDDQIVTSAKLVFKYPTVVTGTSTQMKYFLTGDLAP